MGLCAGYAVIRDLLLSCAALRGQSLGLTSCDHSERHGAAYLESSCQSYSYRFEICIVHLPLAEVRCQGDGEATGWHVKNIEEKQ